VVEDDTLPGVPAWRSPDITATATPVGSPRLASLISHPSIAVYPRVHNLTAHVVEDDTLPGITSGRSPEITATATSARLIVICPESTTYFWPNTCSRIFFCGNGWPLVKWIPVNFAPTRPRPRVTERTSFFAPHKYLMIEIYGVIICVCNN
jgi:hypothetical protein